MRPHVNLVKTLVLVLGVLYIVAPIRGEGLCGLCPVNNYCTNDGIYACPGNQTSPIGSVNITDCTSGMGTSTSTSTHVFTTPGFTTEPESQSSTSTSTPAFTPEPEPQSLSTVTFTATLLISLVEFDSTKREQYVAGVAQVLSVPVSSVSIGTVTENVSRRRRLLATTIDVETIVTVPSEDTGSVAAAATTENLNGELESNGMTTDGVNEPDIQMVVATTPVVITTTTTPITIGDLHEWVPLGC